MNETLPGMTPDEFRRMTANGAKAWAGVDPAELRAGNFAAQAPTDAFPALHALTEAVMTRAGPELVLRRINEAVAIMATRGWSPPIPWPAAGVPLPVQAVHQFRRQHCSDWYDGYPDTSDGGGPYETRTLYKQPAPAAQDPEGLAHQIYSAAQLAPGEGVTDAVDRIAALLVPAAQEPLHPTALIDWLAARYRAAGGKEGITDLSAFCEEVMRWTETKHGITGAAK